MPFFFTVLIYLNPSLFKVFQFSIINSFFIHSFIHDTPEHLLFQIHDYSQIALLYNYMAVRIGGQKCQSYDSYIILVFYSTERQLDVWRAHLDLTRGGSFFNSWGTPLHNRSQNISVIIFMSKRGCHLRLHNWYCYWVVEMSLSLCFAWIGFWVNILEAHVLKKLWTLNSYSK